MEASGFTFIVHMDLTAAATEMGVDNAVGALRDRAGQILAQLRGTLLTFYVTTGSSDLVATIEVPSPEDSVSFAANMAESGLVTTTTMAAYPTEPVILAIQRGHVK